MQTESSTATAVDTPPACAHGAWLSVFQSQDTLSKRVQLDGAGKVVKTAAAFLQAGEVTRHNVATLAELDLVQSAVDHRGAVAYGVCAHDHAAVRSEKRAGDYRGDLPLVCRNSEQFQWPDGMGVMFIDYDPPPGAVALTDEQFIAALRAAMPALANVAFLVRPSSGSCIFSKDGQELVGITGQHAYCFVDGARCIPETGKLLQQRLWLAGHGRIAVGAAGQMMERTIADDAVSQPERLDFRAAQCGAGLVQRLAPARIFPGGVDDIVGAEGVLCANLLDALTAEELRRVDQLKAQARAAAGTAAEAAREQWIAARLPKDDTADAVRAGLQQMLDGGVLPDSLSLQLDGGGSVTVAEIKQHPAEYHGLRCADPLEPDYRGDDRIAVIYSSIGDRAHVYSHAHGGVRYPLFSVEQLEQSRADEFEHVTPDATPSRFPVLAPSAFANGPAPRWIIKGILPQGELVVLFGESGSGKSFLALQLAAAVARGVLWRGRRVKQGRVVYIAAEGAGGFRNRYKAYAQHEGIGVDEVAVDVIAGAPDLLMKEDALDVAASIGRADLVIVDTFAQTTPGGNENSGEDMGKALGHCKNIHRATGATVLLVHHAGKDLTKGARGWSGLRAAADAELEVSRDGNARGLRISKQKDGEDGAVLGFALEPVSIGVDDDGDVVTSCVVVEGSAPAVKTGRPMGAVQAVVHAVIQEFAQAQSTGIEVDAVVAEAERRLPLPKGGGRDRRKEHAQRALKELCQGEGAIYCMEDKCISIP